MTLALVIALALLQGVTEFLPVSSSGHLRLLEAWFGIETEQTLLDIVLHVGTLVPVVIVYRAELGRMARASAAALREPRRLLADADARLVLLVGAATVPTGVVAVLFGDVMERLALDIRAVAACLALTGCILLGMGVLERRAAASDRPLRTLADLTLRDALIIGTLQGIAILRGVSRSGTTITAGLLVGLDRRSAAAFSFLMAIPAILGALVLALRHGAPPGQGLSIFLVGGLVAAASGTLALRWLLRLLQKGQLHHFAWYCFALSASAFAWTFFR
ncbi:MAG: undecaprenyl-diphosphate phosphatase [Deltaproteobacteria bacterium]|nr:undecaprenyl-diphosphate phosphatase [Deltaproteobacteria bacterium]MCB9785571.1 undecaprenyl-diphosphate phosphatase [Deltaproteobacteria bacterium]